MFDKLIESEPDGTRVRDRQTYFLATSVVVGIVFTMAVVLSLYAANIDLGTDNFELTAVLAPVDPVAESPVSLKPEPQRSASTENDIPSRQVNMSRTDEPTIVPKTVSVIGNDQMERPRYGDFALRSFDSNPSAGHGGKARSTYDPGDTSSKPLPRSETTEELKDPEPPPPIRADKPAAPRSLGVVNGRATYLPKPTYPAAAIAVGAQGKVDVQVTIDESGKVISANAISGNPLLRAAAEKAARGARFSPTTLSKVPVKVTGVIVYNFTR